jgi:uncharacterized repeat protein (TIGR03803 family)
MNRGVARVAIVLAILPVVSVVGTTSVHAQTYMETVLHSFTGAPADGTGPGALVINAQGNLYGTTASGGTADFGTVFQMDTTGLESVFYNFTGEGGDGADPATGLVLDAEGNLYGATTRGGDPDCVGFRGTCGTVFKVNTHGEETVLYSFQKVVLDGANPYAGVSLDAQGNLYGTTYRGGYDHPGAGTAFKVDTAGNETVLHDFGSRGDGSYPWSNLVFDVQGNSYGTTAFTGGSTDTHPGGTVFKIDTSGNETVLYSFQGNPDGDFPLAGLVFDAQGNLYGTTYRGGAYDKGTVFKLDANGNETVLHSFSGKEDGEHPQAGLLLDSQGNLYGTTENGGGAIACDGGVLGHGCGTAFKMDTTGNETVLYSFTGTPPSGDGANPDAGLVRDAEGNLYGTTTRGGTTGNGTVFKLTPQ